MILYEAYLICGVIRIVWITYWCSPIILNPLEPFNTKTGFDGVVCVRNSSSNAVRISDVFQHV